TQRTDLLEDPDLATAPGRAVRAEAIGATLAPFFADRTAESIFHEAQVWRLPFGLVPSPTEIYELSPHHERGYFVDMEHPVAGKVKMPGMPFLMSETPANLSRPPLLGEHNEAVYGGLGLAAEHLAELRRDGV